MDLDCERVRGALVLKVVPEQLDVPIAQSFVEPLFEKARQNESVVVDLSNVPLCGSAGFGMLMLCRNRLRGKGGDVILCGMSNEMRRVFTLMRLHLIFNTYDTLKDAVAFARG